MHEPHKTRNVRTLLTIPLYLFCILLLSTLLNAGTAAAEGVSITAEVDKTEITIGDLIELGITVEADTALDVTLPDLSLILDAYEVKDYRQAEPVIRRDGTRVHEYSCSLTTWTTGRWVIPPMTVTYTDSLGQTATASSDSIYIDVKSLLAEAGEDTVDIRDLKPLYTPQAQTAWYYYLAGGIILLGVILWLLFHRRKKTEELEEKDTRTPDERAFDELQELKAMPYLTEEKWREWYFALTEIWRRYLDGRYQVDTLEATTLEVKAILDSLPFDETDRREIEDFLDRADFVKFARQVPESGTPEQDYAWVWAFIERTKIVQVEEKREVQQTGTEG